MHFTYFDLWNQFFMRMDEDTQIICRITYWLLSSYWRILYNKAVSKGNLSDNLEALVSEFWGTLGIIQTA